MINKIYYYVQKVLPLVYDDALSYYELLSKVIAKLNEVIAATNDISQQIKIDIQEWLQTDEGKAVIAEIITEEIDANYQNLLQRTTALETETETLGNEIAAVRNTANSNVPLLSLHGVKCLLIGNSYARGTGGVIDRGWPYYFQQRTLCDATIIKMSGGDFAAVGNENADYPGYNYTQALSAFLETLTADQKKEYRLVVVGGGYNDMSATRNPGGIAAIESGIASFVNLCRTQLVNAKIVIVPLFACTMGFATMEHFLRYQEGWVRYAALYGCMTTDKSIYWFMGKEDYNADNIHLNDTGYWIAGGRIAAVCAGWDGSITERVAGSALDNGANGYYRVYRENQKITVDIDCTFPGGAGTTDQFAHVGPTGTPAKSIRPGGLFIYGTPRSYVPVAVLNTGGLTFQGAGQTMPSEQFHIFGSFTYDLTFSESV